VEQDANDSTGSKVPSLARRFSPDVLDPRLENPSVRLAVEAILKKPVDLSGRRPIRAYAIDSANPKTPMDRDDAINIEFRHDDKLGDLTILHVTIADVASVCPAAAMAGDHRLASLDRHAARNGETLYFSHGVAPMMPRALQDRMSLEDGTEDGKERPGLTVSITFNAQGAPVHTEMSRTRVTTECKSYRGAAMDIKQAGHPIQQMAVLAGHLLKGKEGATNLPRYDEKTGFYTDSEGVQRHVSPDELSAYKTVQGCMIAANEATARLMQGGNFLFRNHSFLYTPKSGDTQVVFRKTGIVDDQAEQSGRLEPNRAEYSPECIGHYGLDSPAYCHVTSPIRRYADLVNQRMMHWAIDVVEAVAAGIATANPAIEEDKVRYAVWEQAQPLLEIASRYKQPALIRSQESRSGKLRLRRELEQCIAGIVQELGGISQPAPGAALESAVAGVQATIMPYRQEDLEGIAHTLNQTLLENRYSRRDFSQTAAWINTVFPNTDPMLISEWSAGSFAELLEAAARRGDNNRVFADEVAKRIHMAVRAAQRRRAAACAPPELNPESGLEDAELASLVQNLHSIIIVADTRKDGHWQELKELAFDRLKHDPQLAEKLFEFMQVQQQKQSNATTQHGAQPDEEQVRELKQTFVVEATLFDRKQTPYPSALVVLSHERLTGTRNGTRITDKKEYSAPVIDAVNSGDYSSQQEAMKVARQSAILTFFRHYGSIYPHDALNTPALIEMELERVRVRRGHKMAHLQKVCDGLFGVQAETCQATASGGYADSRTFEARITVTPPVGDSIVVKATGPEDRALDKAADKMLLDVRFRNLLALYQEPVAPPEQKKVGQASEALPPVVWGNVLEFDRRGNFIDPSAALQ